PGNFVMRMFTGWRWTFRDGWRLWLGCDWPSSSCGPSLLGSMPAATDVCSAWAFQRSVVFGEALEHDISKPPGLVPAPPAIRCPRSHPHVVLHLARLSGGGAPRRPRGGDGPGHGEGHGVRAREPRCGDRTDVGALPGGGPPAAARARELRR